jgi:hypothetical protein
VQASVVKQFSNFMAARAVIKMDGFDHLSLFSRDAKVSPNSAAQLVALILCAGEIT